MLVGAILLALLELNIHMRRWLLPKQLKMPSTESMVCETLRRRLLDEASVIMVMIVFIPPLLEYVESLLTGSGRDYLTCARSNWSISYPVGP